MEYIQLGKTDIEVSRICMGSWQASGWVSSDEEEFLKTLRHGLDRGINFIDTAEAYGNGYSEQLVGKAVKGRRHEVVVATKFTHSNSSPEKMRKSLEQSLKNLGTDYIDLYQQHWPSKKVPPGETIKELKKMKAEGKIRAIGVSNWMEPEWEEIDHPEEIDSLQPCYSLLWRSIEKKVLPMCRDKGISVLPYSPLCQGILTGRFRKTEDIPKDSRLQNKLLQPDKLQKTLKVLDALEEIAIKLGKSSAQIALRWLLDNQSVSSVIVGASKAEQLDNNIGALGWSLDESDYAHLSAISSPLSADLGPHDTLWGWHPKKS